MLESIMFKRGKVDGRMESSSPKGRDLAGKQRHKMTIQKLILLKVSMFTDKELCVCVCGVQGLQLCCFNALLWPLRSIYMSVGWNRWAEWLGTQRCFSFR